MVRRQLCKEGAQRGAQGGLLGGDAVQIARQNVVAGGVLIRQAAALRGEVHHAVVVLFNEILFLQRIHHGMDAGLGDAERVCHADTADLIARTAQTAQREKIFDVACRKRLLHSGFLR